MARPSFSIVELPDHEEPGGTMENISILGIDLGKNVCNLVGLHISLPGSSRWRRAAASIIWVGFSLIEDARFAFAGMCPPLYEGAEE